MSRIVFVCTGNVCRSPFAEALLRHLLLRGLGPGHPLEVTSAGTGALVGQGMTAETLALARRRGVDGRGHRARQLTAATVAGADLVVALARSHRSAVVGLRPAALRSLFTLRELAGLLAGAPVATLPDDPGDRLRALAPFAAAQRGRVPPAGPGLDDVVDPYRRDAAVYEQMAAELVPAVEAVAAVLAPPQDAADVDEVAGRGVPRDAGGGRRHDHPHPP